MKNNYEGKILAFLIIGLVIISACIGLDSNNKSQNLGQSTVLTSNGKSIEINLIKSNIIHSGIPGNPPVYEFIFEVKNPDESGITIYHPFDPSSGGAYYNVRIVDYGGFEYDVMVYGVYEKLADGSYANNMKNVGGAILKLYPNEKILIGCQFLPKKADVGKLKVKTTLHFSFGKGSERTWDITSLFTQ
jgi:hypothetical protein